MARKIIYKFALPLDAEITLHLPDGWQFLEAAVQGDQGPQMWVMLDPDAGTCPRRFAIYDTGQPIDPQPEHLHHLCTFLQGQYVRHLFSLDPVIMVAIDQVTGRPREAWLHENPKALAMVRQGLQESRDGESVKGPDLDADDKLFPEPIDPSIIITEVSAEDLADEITGESN